VRAWWSGRVGGGKAKAAPAEGQDTPETWEHSVEVQVPCLQRVLKKVRAAAGGDRGGGRAALAKTLGPRLDDGR